MSCTTGIVLIFQEQWSVNIAGLPLLHRILLSGHKTGLKQWLVLVWQGAEQVRANLTASAKLQDIDWRVYDVHNATTAHLDVILPTEEVIVVAQLAVFDHRLLTELQMAEGTTLCVTTTTQEPDLSLAVHDGQASPTRATAAPLSYAIGLLRCSGTHLAHVMQRSWAMSWSPSPLAALVTTFLAYPPVHVVDVSQHLWIPITTPVGATVATAETELLQRLGRQNESPVVRKLSRPLSRMLTKRLMRTAVTPNQITLGSALLGISGACLLAQPVYHWQVLGTLLFLMSTIIDGCDGEIARLTFQESAFGAKLDIIMDNVVHCFLFPCIALGLYLQHDDRLYLLLGGLVVLGVFLSIAVYVPYRLYRQDSQSPRTRLHDSLASRDFAYLLPLLALGQKLHWFLWATAVGTYVFAIAWVVIAQRERQRQRQRLTDAESAAP
jgi:phosphatidylglycerophosphate synthase